MRNVALRGRGLVFLAVCALTLTSTACGPPSTPDVTRAPGGLANACPSLDEAQGAMPGIARGPDHNLGGTGVVLRCFYLYPSEPDPGVLQPVGEIEGITITVSSATEELRIAWEGVRAGAGHGDLPELADAADVAFSTIYTGRITNVWVIKGTYAFTFSNSRFRGAIPGEQFVALARAMLAGLARAG